MNENDLRKHNVEFLDSSTLQLVEGNSLLRMVFQRVERPFGEFKKNDIVIEARLKSTDAKEMVSLFRRFKKLEPYFKAKGIAGFYGVTSNTAIMKHFQKRGARIRRVGKPTEKRLRADYQKNVKEEGFSPKYLKTPVRRITHRW